MHWVNNVSSLGIMGRPPAEEKTKIVAFRVTESVFAELEELARAAASASGGLEVSAQGLAKLACMRGMDVLRREYGKKVKR